MITGKSEPPEGLYRITTGVGAQVGALEIVLLNVIKIVNHTCLLCVVNS